MTPPAIAEHHRKQAEGRRELERRKAAGERNIGIMTLPGGDCIVVPIAQTYEDAQAELERRQVAGAKGMLLLMAVVPVLGLIAWVLS